MIRILHVVSKLSLNSGVMNVIMNYYRHTDRTKIQFDFLYFEEWNPDFKDEIKNLGGNIFSVNKPSLKHIYRTYKEFNFFLSNNYAKYTAVHLHEVYLVHFISYFCKKYGIKHLITHAHTTKYSDNPKNALRNRMMCLGLKKSATDYFACSKAAGEFYYGKEAVANGLVKVIPNAIDLEKYKFNQAIREKIRKSLNIEDKFVVGHIGRMAPPKNQKFLLQIFKKVKKERTNSILLMIGNGPLKKEIESEIKRLNLQDSVILLGVRNDVPNLLMAMDVFVLPSLSEGLGIVAMEAQASGLKCILSDKVPVETDMGGAKYISLQTYCKQWASAILNCEKKHNRNSYLSNLIKNGYSIKESVEALQNYYIKLSR